MKKRVYLLALLMSVLVMSTTVALGSSTNGDIWVKIDVKPGSCPNSINLKSNGVVPVAILTTYDDPDWDDFDATTVDPPTVRFAGAPPLRWAIEDVNDDGYMDMILHFKTQELDTTTFYEDEYGTWAPLMGFTLDTTAFISGGTVNLVPKDK